ncbi:YitT family protein [Bacillus sp. DTU_2020_1000418_1_SI_GHA_SEK_038]|uniref:YczE/YyaS/YitT family protein n=1 Tax=Bacillus sp. DTU_2020_1000418_1_SI_GHA_SEK_038 TaxID=3077585 RepID=UPI0028EAD56D|nr:YitT family protein [Bacillus sp. DTU_2020_1000418_1_SI_GHA_SEK_038]WNS77631.1 YitT family protein [Bacillus sp. DTU_2020_1000418_1_SI_GHA_SEK_038]
MIKRGQIGSRFIVFIVGLLVMTLGAVLLILADLGATPWDIFHVGLYYQFGLTIGSWSIIVGFVILALSSVILKEFPKMGAFLNMVLFGLFMDFYLMLPFMQTPSSLTGKIIMFIFGIITCCYGMGIYISAQFGAGPRDSLMIALTSKTGWKVAHIRLCMEIAVLLIGWQLGGPVFWGTIIIGISIGPIAGIALPQCQNMTDRFLAKMKAKNKVPVLNEKDRGVS